MPLTGSGQITLANVATEKGASSSNISLTLESTSGINTNSPSYPDGAAPHQLSEFYNYDHNASGGGSWPPPYLVPEAQTFLESIGNMVENNITTAINQLVLDMQGAGNYASAPWYNMYFVYPFVGGTATAHRFNLIDPNQYIIGWNGGVTHDANGVTGNGSNGYGLTNFLADGAAPRGNNVFLGSYCGNNTAQNGYDMGATSGGNVLGHISRYGGNQVYFRPFNAGANQTTSVDSSGWNWTSRNGDSRTIIGGKNDQFNYYPVTSVTTNIPEYVNILALRTAGGGNTAYSNKNLRMAMIGYSVDEGMATDLYYMIQDFQNTLGRAV